MVHNKNDVASPRSFAEKKEGNSDDRENGGIIQPEWKIDDDGIPYCKLQPNNDKII